MRRQLQTTLVIWRLAGWLLLFAVLMFLPSSSFLSTQKEVIPNDPYWKYQLSFHNPGGNVVINSRSWTSSAEQYEGKMGIDLNITRTWAITTGSKNVVVAVLDDGFCYNHPDIKDNIWHNPGETGKDANGFDKETNGLDDDHNGYVDDVMGWDFVFDTPDPDCHVFDGRDKTKIASDWHSMGALGIIGAKGNNGIGVAGINWNVSMMLLRIGVQGIGQGEVDLHRIDRVVEAIHYAADNGARIINWSGSTSDRRPEKLAELRQAIDYAGRKNVLIVVAAGNDLKDLDDDANCQRAPDCFESENLIKVAEVDLRGDLYRAPSGGHWIGGSNYGKRRVQIAAIAMNYTTSVKDGASVYWLSGGTSNAAPVVSGVAALMLSVNLNLSALQLKDLLLRTATKLPGLKGKLSSEGMVNAYEAVVAAKALATTSLQQP